MSLYFKSMARSIKEIVDFLIEHHRKQDITLQLSATEAEILAFEALMKQKLPEDLRYFYSKFNGIETPDWLFRIIPLEEICKNNEGAVFPMKSFAFAEYMIYSESWYISFSSANHEDYVIYDSNDDSKVNVTNSFSEFLDILLTKGVMEGLYSYRKPYK